ncbi:hypothetical protein RUM43_011523 [Polyplax serrata]|uniref:AB hydrolase-1 domain-containing protein n=1 Tax=Polyplax serrata TaxID=468196 RepID=A0AAN8PF92_POLSC
MSECRRCVELSFPVPWGIIAAKAWGDPCLPPVLMVHGIQDNAGTFDRLMPMLPDMFYYVCIDLPGHGKSNRFPKGVFLNFMLYLSSIRRVVQQLHWVKYHYIGHSLGGQLGTYYASFYPDEVTKLIILDTLAPTTLDIGNYIRKSKKQIEEIIELENKLLNSNSKPNYTYEEAIRRVVNGRKAPISIGAAEVLAARSLKKNNKNFYYFSTDQRLKFGVPPLVTSETHLNIIQNIQCPMLLIITHIYLEFVKSTDHSSAYDTYKLLQTKNNVQIVQVTGQHDVHNDNPEVVAPHINEFLLKIKSLL